MYSSICVARFQLWHFSVTRLRSCILAPDYPGQRLHCAVLRCDHVHSGSWGRRDIPWKVRKPFFSAFSFFNSSICGYVSIWVCICMGVLMSVIQSIRSCSIFTMEKERRNKSLSPAVYLELFSITATVGQSYQHTCTRYTDTVHTLIHRHTQINTLTVTHAH